MNTAKRVLGDYIGNRMIGIKSIATFKVFLGGKLKSICLNERRAAEKGWFLILNECNANLEKIEASIDKLELFLEKLKLP